MFSKVSASDDPSAIVVAQSRSTETVTVMLANLCAQPVIVIELNKPRRELSVSVDSAAAMTQTDVATALIFWIAREYWTM